MCCGGSSVPVALGSFVFVCSVLWWINYKFDQIIKEIKKK